MRHRYIVLFAAILAVVAFSCSRGGGILVPPISQTPNSSQSTSTVPQATAGHSLWVYEEVYVDPASMTYEVLPSRQVETHWNVLSWLENAPCTTCFQITNFVPSGIGTLLVDIKISHPFSSPNLTGFDVHGIAMFTGSRSFPGSGLNTPDKTLGDGELVNADGYTTLYNISTAGSGPGGRQGYTPGNLATAALPSAKLNGFKRYVSSDPANTRNAFYAGGSVTQTYEISMPTGPFVFGYAVDASWAPPVNKPVTNPMTDFGPEANSPEPWKVVVTDTPVGQGLTNLGGKTTLAIDVYSVYPSQFTVTAEAPALFDTLLSTDVVTGSGSGYTRYEIPVENLKLAPAGDYECLISVTNKANPPAPAWIDQKAYQIRSLKVNTAQPTVTWDNTIGSMLASNCSPCHITGSSGGVKLDSYLHAMNSGVISPGNPNSSLLYTNIKDGTHDGHLTSSQLQVLYNWILNGAPEK